MARRKRGERGGDEKDGRGGLGFQRSQRKPVALSFERRSVSSQVLGVWALFVMRSSYRMQSRIWTMFYCVVTMSTSPKGRTLLLIMQCDNLICTTESQSTIRHYSAEKHILVEYDTDFSFNRHGIERKKSFSVFFSNMHDSKIRR